MNSHRLAASAAMAICVFSCSGALMSRDELAATELVVRYALKYFKPACTNYGRKDAWCLSIRHDMDPPPRLLARFSDVQPPILSATECRRRGIIGEHNATIDPTITVARFETREDGSLKARVTLGCTTSSPLLFRDSGTWRLQPAGAAGCGPVPGDCRSDGPPFRSKN